MRKLNTVLGAFAAVAAMSASSAAMAQCVGTGTAATVGGVGLAGIAQGGAIATLVSSINTLNTAFLTQSTAFVGAPGNPRPNQEGGGIWARGIGGEINTKNNSSSTYSLFGAPLTGGINCNTETNLRFVGTQVGTDMARLNWNGWNVHIGSMVGYAAAKANDTTGVGPMNPFGGTFQNSMEVPFAGIYAAATYGGFFVDGQIRFDYIQNRLNDPRTSGIFDQGLDAKTISGTLNVGYNHQLGNGWFIEPSAGIVVSRTEVDPLNISGTLVLLNNPGLSPPGTLAVSDIKSTLGRLSLRTGTTIVTDKVVWQPFATASVYHEFEGAVNSSFIGAPFGGLNLINASISTDRVGTYGQFGVGVAGQLTGTGWLGYVRGDYRTGDKIDGWSLNGGVRYQFTPDMPALAPKGLIAKAPALPVVGVYNWNGWYVGANFGAINGSSKWVFQGFGTRTDPKFAGPAVGGQIGYDWQFGKWVVGLEGSANWANAHGTASCPNGFFFSCETKVNWLATGTARLGYALYDRSIIYVKGGVAGGEVELRTACNTDSQPLFVVALTGCPAQTGRDTRIGYTVGFGSEFALAQNWTVKGETNYFDLGKSTISTSGGSTFVGAVATPALTGSVVDAKVHGFISTVGLNYRFAPTLR